MRPWRASWPHSRRSTSTTPASAAARRHGGRCSNTSKCSIIGSGYTRASATVPRPRPVPAWEGSACAQPGDVLIPPLHSPGAGPELPAHLAFLEVVHNARRRRKALLATLVGALVPRALITTPDPEK